MTAMRQQLSGGTALARINLSAGGRSRSAVFVLSPATSDEAAHGKFTLLPVWNEVGVTDSIGKEEIIDDYDFKKFAETFDQFLKEELEAI